MTAVADHPAGWSGVGAISVGQRVTPVSHGRILLAAIPIAAVIILGMALGLRPLTAAGVGAAIVAAIVSPPLGLLLLAFMGSLKQPDVLPVPGFNFVLMGAVLLGCIYRLPIDRPRVRLTAPLLLLLAFFLYAFAQQSPEMIAGYQSEEARRIGSQLIQLATLVGTAIAAGYIMSGRRPYPFMAACLAAALLASLLTIATYDNPVASSPLAGLLAHTDDGTRAVGPFGNPNYFGESLATGMATALGWGISAGGRAVRWLLVGVAVLVGAALALSLSRGAIAALLAGLACLAILRSRPLGAALVILGLVGVVVVYPAFVEWRLGGVAYSALNESDSSRLDAVLAGPQLFLSSPLFGVGFGQYSSLSAQFTEGHFSIGSHNWYMNVLAEQGLVGAVLWSLLLVSVVLQLRSRAVPARLVGFGVLAVFAAGSLFTTQPASFQTAVLPLIVICAALVGDWKQTTEPDQFSSSPPGETGDRPVEAA